MKPGYRITYLVHLLFLCGGVALCHAGEPDCALSNPLYVNPASQDFSKNVELIERIRSGPHGYFRFINIPFTKEVCHRFAGSLGDWPSLNLHGDAHIEQYAVTDLGRGLTDYDDSCTGPGVIDLLRFGVSLELACEAHGWGESVEELFVEFLRGYRDALNSPGTTTSEPTVAKRIRSTFKTDRDGYFKWVHSIMEPISQEERDSLLVAIQPYVETMLTEDPTLNENYFDVTRIGYLRLGIGSALDLKYLVQVRGETDDPSDDLVLELKEVRDLSGIDCIKIRQRFDPFRILLGQARIAYQPFRHLGYFRFRGRTFWVHSWVDNYKELKVGRSFRSAEETVEVAYDVGLQLGKGHVKQIAAPLDLQLRREQLEVLKKHETEISKVRRELAKLTVAAWQRFCESLNLKYEEDNEKSK